MKTYKPVMSEEKPIIKFTKKELEKLLYKLKKSGADEIGVEIEEQ